MRLEILGLLDALQAPGPEPTIPDGPGDIPGYEVPRDLPSKGFDAAAKWGVAGAGLIAAVIVLYIARSVINAIPWKIVGPVLIIIVLAILAAR